MELNNEEKKKKNIKRNPCSHHTIAPRGCFSVIKFSNFTLYSWKLACFHLSPIWIKLRKDFYRLRYYVHAQCDRRQHFIRTNNVYTIILFSLSFNMLTEIDCSTFLPIARKSRTKENFGRALLFQYLDTSLLLIVAWNILQVHLLLKAHGMYFSRCQRDPECEFKKNFYCIRFFSRGRKHLVAFVCVKDLSRNVWWNVRYPTAAFSHGNCFS